MNRLGLAIVCVALWASAAEAAPVTFEYSGTIDSVGFYDPGVFSDPLGTTFSGSYSFDSLAADTIPGSLSSGYSGSSVSLSLAGQTFAFGSVSIGVNDFAGLDQYLVGFANSTTFLSIILEDLQGTAFGSDALPLTPPPLGPFELRSFFFQLQDDGFNLLVDVNGTITSLTCTSGCNQTDPDPNPQPVPEPATLWLASAGVAALTVRRRARKA